MATVITLERPSMVAIGKTQHTRNGGWDWTGLSDAEIKADLQRISERAKKEYHNGQYKLVEEVYKEWAEERRGCGVTE